MAMKNGSEPPGAGSVQGITKILLPVLILLLLLGIALWVRRPRPGKEGSPAPIASGTIPPGEVPGGGTAIPNAPAPKAAAGALPPKALPPIPDLLARTLTNYREATRTRSQLRATRFQREYFFGLREARLACLVDPRGAEEAALRFIHSEKADPVETEFGIDLLGFLTRQGEKGAESALVGVATGSDPAFARYALDTLYEVDDKGAHQSLYLKSAANGDATALRMIGTWPDPQAMPALKDLVDKHPGLLAPASTIRLAAEAAIERETIIESPQALDRIGEILSEKNRDDLFLTDWAIRVAQGRPPSNLASLCRERLNVGEQRALDVEASGIASKMMKPGRTEQQFLTAPHVQETGDRYFDEILLLLQASQGPLTEMEVGRLKFLGYAGDPESRLRELVGEDQ